MDRHFRAGSAGEALFAMVGNLAMSAFDVFAFRSKPNNCSKNCPGENVGAARRGETFLGWGVGAFTDFFGGPSPYPLPDYWERREEECGVLLRSFFQLSENGRKVGLVVAPAAYGAGVDGLADLPDAGSQDGVVGAVELEAVGVPGEAEKIY
jgi:hypothetical protein